MGIYMVDKNRDMRLRLFVYCMDCITFLRDWEVEG